MKTKLSKERIFYMIMTVLIAATIFLFSNLTSMPGKITGLNLATVYHIAIFFAFTFFLTLSIKSKQLNKKTIVILLLISLAYALSDEFHQLFVPGRFSSLNDVLVDMIGSALAVLTISNLRQN